MTADRPEYSEIVAGKARRLEKAQGRLVQVVAVLLHFADIGS
jgi:hypothetical protein